MKRFVCNTVVLLLAVALWACSDESKNTATSRRAGSILAVEATVLHPQYLENKITATGTIFANEEVELKSEIPGRVTGIYFEEGSRVKKGQLLVKLDDADLKAQLKKLKVQERFSKQDSARQAQLMEVSATTQEVYDAALSRLNTTQADMELVQVQIEKTEIRAPFDGVIGLRQISPGSYLTPTVIISLLQEIDPVKIEFKVPEKYTGQVQEGMKIFYKVTSSLETYAATVYAVEPRIDFNTRTITARAKSRNRELQLLPGGFAEIEIVLEKMDDALIAPSQSVIPDLNGQVVYLYKNGKVEQRAVQIGVRSERTVQISGGVDPMDTVITTGLLQVKNEMPVEIKKIIETEKTEDRL